ncbi:hypothetical protein ZWY2020_059486 [Hordeum vulgare]|nr:hypothetical protein ZWY2020_059486 [Hordeum vulgare]
MEVACLPTSLNAGVKDVMAKVNTSEAEDREVLVAEDALVTGSQASSSATNANPLEIAELNWKLQVSDEELDRLNGRFDEKHGEFV